MATQKAETASTVAPRRFKKAVTLRAPYLNYQTGQSIVGKVVNKFEEENRFNRQAPKQVIEVELLEEVADPGNKKHKPRTFAKGEVIRLNVKPGCSLIWTFEPGQEFELIVAGKVPSDKGNEAWSFECYTP